jgi:hypothetical protein
MLFQDHRPWVYHPIRKSRNRLREAGVCCTHAPAHSPRKSIIKLGLSAIFTVIQYILKGHALSGSLAGSVAPQEKETDEWKKTEVLGKK